MVTSILVILMELVALALVLVLLYSYRYAIGTAPTYIAAGLYYIFALLVGSTRLIPEAETANAISLGNGILWLPFVLLLLIVYEVEGTGAAQRFFLGLVITTALFVLLYLMLFLQAPPCQSGPFAEFFAAARNLIANPDARMGIIHGITAHIFLFLLVPIIYQAISNQGNKFYGFAVFASMLVYMVLMEALSAIYVWGIADSKAFTPASPAVWGARLGAAAALATIGHSFIVLKTPCRKRNRKILKFLTGFVDLFFAPERMMRSLSEWSERYRVVVENSSELILLVTTDGKIMNANRIATKYLGHILDEKEFKLDQVVFTAHGEPWKWTDSLPPEAPMEDHDAMPQKRVYHCQDIVLRVPEKKNVDLDLNVSRVQLDGQPIAVIIGRDVTAQKEEERQRQNQQEQRMHSQRLESLGELAGGIAHDFNNLLQSIQISTDALRQKCADNPNAGHLIENVEEGCRRASALTSQLLGFARKGKFHADELDASALLDHALQLFLPVAKGLVCKTICEPVPMPLYVDEIQLSQVLLNMLINARDALKDAPEPRRITLRAEVARDQMPEWEFRPKRNAVATDYICIHVRDNGAGMPEEVRRRIFEPFFTTKPAGHGTGMGLPMAFGCVANHHGWIHVDSEPGQGCHITIFLPKAGTAAAQGGPLEKDSTSSPLRA